MIFRIFPQKDTFITNYKYRNVAQTASNFGSSEILHIFKELPITGSANLARILTKFDLSSMSSLTASTVAPPSGIRYHLVMKNAQHGETLPYSFDIETQALTQDWDEGRGHDVDSFSDKGVANWDKAKNNSWWSVAGASGSGPFASCHFDSGHEDLEIDVTDIVNNWLVSGSTNNGFLVKLSSSQESDSSDYYIKMFHGRETNFKDKRPYLQASWDDSRRDDRSNFVFDNTGSLYLYNTVRGQLTNIAGVGTGQDVITVRIVDSSGTIATFSGSHTGIAGLYSASFAIPSASYSGSVFSDIWYVGARVFMTGTFSIGGRFANSAFSNDDYLITIKNMKDRYQTSEVTRMNMFVRPKDYNPAVVLTASIGSTGVVLTKAYYQVENDHTDEVVVPFGTGSTETTRLSYDGNGNYFTMYMSNFAPGNVYRITFLIDIDGQRKFVDKGFKFKVI